VAGGRWTRRTDIRLQLQPTPAVINAALMDCTESVVIGWQACRRTRSALAHRQRLLDPARDATRNGWDAVTVDGSELDGETAAILNATTVKTASKWQPSSWSVWAGTRHPIAISRSQHDPDYYTEPFNPTAWSRESYKVSHSRPYWCAPLPGCCSTSDRAIFILRAHVLDHRGRYLSSLHLQYSAPQSHPMF